MRVFWFCMSSVSALKKSHPEVYKPSFRFTVNFLASPPIPHTPISFEAPLPLGVGGLGACPEMAVPFRDAPGSLQCLGAGCFLVPNVLCLQQKCQR